MTERPGTSGQLARGLRLLTGLALWTIIVWWLVPGPDDRQALLARVRLAPLWLAVGLAATLLASLVTSARWRRMAEDAMGGTRLPYLVYFHALVLTRVLGQVSSTLAMDLVGRGVALRRAGAQHGLGHSVTQAVLERIFDLVLPLLMLAWAIACWRLGWDRQLALVGFVAVCLAFAGLATLLLAPLTRLALRCLAAVDRLRARPVTATVVPPVSRGLALRVGGLSLARYLAVLVQFWAVAAGLGIDLDALQIAAATPIGQLAGMVGVTPGALGIQEAGWLGALAWVGVEAPAIAVFVLGQRLVLTASFGLLSLASWLLLRRSLTSCPPGQVQ